MLFHRCQDAKVIRDESLGDVWLSDYIPSPCVAGFVRPQIYLTFGIDEGERACVLAHERQHVRNHDHVWKALGWLVMCLHWFNPALWMHYKWFLNMIEDACDQRVLRELGEERKADYGEALLSLSTGKRFHPGLSPLAFGEGDTKERVKTVLEYRKPLAWLTAAALVLCVVVGAGLLTGRAEDPAPAGIDAAYGTYKADGVIHLTALSSMTGDYLLEQWKGREIEFAVDRFHMGDVDVEQPVYVPLELGDVLHTTEMGDAEFQSMSAIDLTEYTSVQGWRVVDAGGTETGVHVFAVDGNLWLGRWVFHDNAATPYGEYWEIISARRAWTFAPAVEASAPVPSGQAVDSPVPSGAAQDAKPAEDSNVTFTARVEMSDPDMGTLTVRPEKPVAGVDLFRLDYWNPSLFKAGDRMLVKAHNITEGNGPISSGQLNVVIPLSNVVAEWRVDLTHDGVEERVYVADCGERDGNSFLVVENVSLNSGPEIIWYGGAARYHAGQNGLYLYKDPADGSYGLLRWVPYESTGLAGYSYQLFTLSPDGTEQVRREGALDFETGDIWSADPAEMRQFDKEINELLDHSVVLLSTNYDTPEGVYWGDPEDPMIPIGPFDSGADYFETRQAVAQGTYSFTGEIVDVLEDGVVVRDETLWTAINKEEVHQFFIPAAALDVPLDDPGLPLEGRMVTVTADGPLYLRNAPAEGTRVEARLTAAAPRSD